MDIGNSKRIARVNLDDFEEKATLGTGSFGRVKLIQRRSDERCFALKVLRKAAVIKQKQVDHLFSEVTIMGKISHPFIVEFFGIAQDERYFCILLEFVPGGELFTYLKLNQQLDGPETRFFAAQVVLAFEYLHLQGIIYRDLKPENLLIDRQGYLKLIDFGFAKLTRGRTYTLCGTPEYIAPEIILNKGHGKEVDWWCLGVLIYEMMVGIDPFADDDPMSIFRNILGLKLKFPSRFSPDARSLIRHLLEPDLAKRFGNLRRGVADIKEHKWFQGTLWKDIIEKKLKPKYLPSLKGEADASSFAECPDSPEPARPLKKAKDPFLLW